MRRSKYNEIVLLLQTHDDFMGRAKPQAVQNADVRQFLVRNSQLFRKFKNDDEPGKEIAGDGNVIERIHNTHLHLAHAQDCRLHKIIVEDI